MMGRMEVLHGGTLIKDTMKAFDNFKNKQKSV